MAFSNTYNTTNPGSAASNREDLSNIITRVVPEQAPVYSMARKQSCTATFHEWTVDKLKTPSTLAGGVSEGADVTSFSDQHEDRSRIGNYIQGFRDTWGVSRVQGKAAQAGGDPVALAKSKAVINVKRGIEYTICSTNDRQAETGAGSPYKLRALGDWIDSAGPPDVPADYRTPSGSAITGAATLTEAAFQDLVRSIFSASGEAAANTLVAGTTLRSRISGFSRIEGTDNKTKAYTVNENATSKTITYAVNYFTTDYGNLAIVNGNPDCLTVTTGYVLNHDMYYVADYLPMQSSDLEDQGGGRRGLVECWLTLAVKNPRAFGKFTA